MSSSLLSFSSVYNKPKKIAILCSKTLFLSLFSHFVSFLFYFIRHSYSKKAARVFFSYEPQSLIESKGALDASNVLTHKRSRKHIDYALLSLQVRNISELLESISDES